MIDPITGLEDHATGGATNAIVNANWLVLKQWLDPATSDSDPLFTVLTRGILKLTEAEVAALADGLVVTWNATTNRMQTVAIPTVTGVTLATHTVAGLPSAASHPRQIRYVSNGDSGSPCLAVSDGTNWKRIALGATVST